MKIKFLTLLISLLSFSTFSQLKQGEIGLSGIAGYSIIQTNDTGYAIAGTSSGGNSFAIFKLDKDGNLTWTKNIGSGNYNEAYSLVQTKDGGYAMTGYTQVYGAGGMDVYVVKLDSVGTLQWTRTIGGPDDDWGEAIVQTNDGGYAITGATKSYGGGVPSLADIYVIKLDSGGNKIWTKTVEGPYGTNDEGWAIIESDDKGLVVTGSIYKGGGDNMYVFKMDSVGNLKWGEVLDSGVEGYSIIQTFDKGYAITGSTPYGLGIRNVYVVKLDSLGDLKWTRMIGGSNEDVGYSIIQTSDSGFLVAGVTNSFGSGGSNIYIVKLDSVGNLKWANTYGSAPGGAYGVVQSNYQEGYAIIASEGASCIFLRIDSSGNTCISNGTGGIIDSGGSITNGGVITSSDSGRIGTGGSVSSGGSETVICESTGIENLKHEEPVLEVYPNPSYGLFQIEISPDSYRDYELGMKCNIEVYNVFGQNILTLSLPREGDGNLLLDLHNEPAGLYLVKISGNKFTETAKLIIQK